MSTMTTGERTNTTDAEKSRLIRLFDDTRKRLVETGTRNRLVHVNRTNTRGNVINVVNERSDDVYAILASGKAMRFLAIGRDKDDVQDFIKLANAGDADFDVDRYTDAQLETRIGPNALQKRLLKIAHEAQTAEEETGVNILYLALGFLTWLEDKSSSAPREAPLVLLPVELVRNQRTSTYDIRLRDEDILTNLPLQQRLKEDFGIHIPDLEIEEPWKPTDYFSRVKEVIAHHPNWKVDHDGIQLGFFSFSKLLMYRDLAPDAWPDGVLAEHALTRGLLFEGFEGAPSFMGPHDRLDERLPPENVFHVVDADASQAVVIEEVRRGRNLVVQGPPGTGKSQTITNIIAAAVREGRRVLFVAEKMAALSVVHDRLVKVGLRDICLELHSRNVNKKVVLAELARTLSAATAVPELPGPPTALTRARDCLNELDSALHKPIGDSGETPYTALSQQSNFIGRGMSAPVIPGDPLAALSTDKLKHLCDSVTRYGEVIATEGSRKLHPFSGVRNLDLQPVDLTRLSKTLSTSIVVLTDLINAQRNAISELHITLPLARESVGPLIEVLSRLNGLHSEAKTIAGTIFAAPDLSRLEEFLEAGAKWRKAADSCKGLFIEAASTISPSTIRGAIAAGAQSMFARWGGAYRRASRELAGVLQHPLPKTAQERLALIDHLIAIELQKSTWKADEDFCTPALGDAWRAERTDFDHLLSVAQWCRNVKSAPIACEAEVLISLATEQGKANQLRMALERTDPAAAGAIEEIWTILNFDPRHLGDDDPKKHDLAQILNWIRVLSENIDRYQGWVSLCKLQKAEINGGAPEVARRMESGELQFSDAVNEIRFARAEHLWKKARGSSPVLEDIAQLDRHELVRNFAELERARLKENVRSIVSSHLSQVPQGALGEMKVIRGEIGKKRGHIALRKLFSTAGNALQRIKPVMLMSPISVAQFVPPGALTFDLLVIDEASQVRPEDALGAIARAKQIVVVGDQKQLPPSSFFDRLLDDEAEVDDDEDDSDELLGAAAKVGEMESILSLCEARGLNSRMLQWHYRSRDPSLIQVSNQEFYDSQLILPPSPLQNDPTFGLCFTRVDGVYDKGGKRDNRIEGEAIVQRVAEHARHHPDISLGIVTFSSAQKNLITELLELRRRTDPILDRFLREGRSEELFVKNIENVQGDERDVILVSVCYGPVQAGGKLTSMSFGPVNADGGQRRLNVLFTRARIRCEVFASFHPSEINPERSKRDGTRILKKYLEFANGDALLNAGPTSEMSETPFEEDVATVIRDLGYFADHQVGSAGFRIDLGIRHPDRPGMYILAVECDGATYHGALWARERDRLRQDVLEHLGWNFHRVWSTDWFYNRAAEIKRLRDALDAARVSAEAGIALEGANEKGETSVLPVEPISISLPEVTIKQMPIYKRYHIALGEQEPHELHISVMSDLVTKIVTEEGPIHFEEASRRVASCFGKEKAGSRIINATKAALQSAQRQQRELMSDGIFWYMKAHVDTPIVRDRSLESGPTVKASSISLLEIRAALKIARDENPGGEEGELIRSAARLLGFKRVGAELQERITGGLND